MAIEGIGLTAVEFATKSILGTIVGNAGERVFHQAREAVGDVLRKGGRPVNHELQRGVRAARVLTV